MDFFRISEEQTKKSGTILKAIPLVEYHDDLMIQGGDFYAVWDEAEGMWSRDIRRFRQIIDDALHARQAEIESTGQECHVLECRNFSNGQWKLFKNFISLLPDSYTPLDQKIIFQNSVVTKKDYASKRLPYSLSDAPCPNYDELMSTIYSPEERQKLEWAMGSVFAGESTKIQRFVVMYGDPGTGKSTVIKLIQMLFEGYCGSVDVAALTTESNQFKLESFKKNPLVGFQDDTDLSKLTANSQLNSVASHEIMTVNAKHKSVYELKINTMIFAGSNTPVRITDAQSGLIRRLLDVTPTGDKVEPIRYEQIMDAIPFELGAIASHCMNVYRKLGRHFYDSYRPIAMMLETDPFYNFVEDYYYEFKEEEYMSLDLAWGWYKDYCIKAGIFQGKRTMVRDQLKNYYEKFYEQYTIPGKGRTRKVYIGFLTDKFIVEDVPEEEMAVEEYEPMKLELKSRVSELDVMLADCPAQYANEQETPLQKWEKVTTTLKELDTTKLHYIFFPEEMKSHIVVDFDLKDENGEKSAEKNLEAAAKWPATYAEFSKGGAGIHLHYIYDGDVSKLSALYAPGIEIKVFNGKSSLRRRLSWCNDLPVAHISSGLPMKEAKKVVSMSRIASEKGLRNMIERNLRKEIVPATKPSIDFIYKDLERAYEDGMIYDVRDMRPKILAFAAGSTHQYEYCVKLVNKMKFASEKQSEFEDSGEAPMVVYDVECYQNLFLVCWKQLGEGHEVVKMFNPSPQEIERMFAFRLISFNGSNYDSQLMYARYLGYSNMELYNLSKKLISASKSEAWKYKFKEARNVEYADIYDFASKKQSLKKWQIELKIHHQESEPDWDKPLPEDQWEECGEYCANDVVSTEALFNHLQGDFTARKILADIAGMPINTSTNNLVAKIIFGNERKPKLVYTDLRNGEQWTEERRWYNELETE